MIVAGMFAYPAHAGSPTINFNIPPPPSMNIPWNSSSISMSQLQGIMSQYPGVNQFNLQFPNNTSWSVTPSGLQSMYSNYLQQAQSLGYKGGVPDLSFSSLHDMHFDANMLTVPIDSLSTSFQSAIDNGLRELRYQQMHLSDALPDWLKEGLLTVWNGIVTICDYIREKLSALF